MSEFAKLLSDVKLLANLSSLGHEVPTPVQEQAIPVILQGHDVLGIAQTGTGKTGAFCLPILQKILSGPPKGKAPRILILAPTRELCSQIHLAVESYSQSTMIRSCAVYGGVGSGPQMSALREGVDVIVATPGRLLDFLEKGILRLRSLDVLVIDEADRMLDMGFIEDIQAIINELPSERQNLLFSATMPLGIKHLAARILTRPVTIEATSGKLVGASIVEEVILCKAEHKFQLLRKILKEGDVGLVIVFTRTKVSADGVVDYLAQNRIASRAIHGDKMQTDREKSIAQFSQGSMKVLVATDLVSRGIDVEGISHVINFDLPLDPEAYVHRIGRTARAGQSGKAISFCDDDEANQLRAIEDLLKRKFKVSSFKGKPEVLKLRVKKPTPPTPGRSQEKPAWYDHSQRQRVKDDGKKIHINPAFKKKKKSRK